MDLTLFIGTSEQQYEVIINIYNTSASNKTYFSYKSMTYVLAYILYLAPEH